MEITKKEIGNAKKVSKAHVTPIWGQNVCDSTTEKEVCVRFAIAISAVPTVEVTRLIYNLPLPFEVYTGSLEKLPTRAINVGAKGPFEGSLIKQKI